MKRIEAGGLLLFMFTLLLSVFGIMDATAVCATAPAPGGGDAALSQPENEYADDGLDGGVMGEDSISLGEALANSPNLVTRKIHDQVIIIGAEKYLTRSLMSKNFRIRKPTKDHTVAVYSAETAPVLIGVVSAYTEQSGVELVDTINFGVAGATSSYNKFINKSQTIIFPNIKGYKTDGTTIDTHCLMCIVTDKTSSGVPVLKAINGKKVGGVITIPTFTANQVALRGKRVGTEKQLHTDHLNILPTDTAYYVSKNIITFSVTGWFDNATKEVKWGLNEIKDLAMIEKSRTAAVDFWLSTGTSAYVSNEFNGSQADLAYFSEGAWYQADSEFDFEGTVNVDKLADFLAEAFEYGSSTKYWAVGKDVLKALQKVVFNETVQLGETYRDKELKMNFASIDYLGKKMLFAHDVSLDDCGMSDCGFVLDQKYGFEYSYPYRVETLDSRNTKMDIKGQSLIEENVFILEHKKAHMRVKLGTA